MVIIANIDSGTATKWGDPAWIFLRKTLNAEVMTKQRKRLAGLQHEQFAVMQRSAGNCPFTYCAGAAEIEA